MDRIHYWAEIDLRVKQNFELFFSRKKTFLQSIFESRKYTQTKALVINCSHPQSS
jgi:hypothetical protein